MSKPLSETKQKFEALMARVPDPSAVSQKQRINFVLEAWSLAQEADKRGAEGIGLRTQILAQMRKLLGDSGKPPMNSLFGISAGPANLLFDEFTTRFEKDHNSDQGMLAR